MVSEQRDTEATDGNVGDCVSSFLRTMDRSQRRTHRLMWLLAIGNVAVLVIWIGFLMRFPVRV